MSVAPIRDARILNVLGLLMVAGILGSASVSPPTAAANTIYVDKATSVAPPPLTPVPGNDNAGCSMDEALAAANQDVKVGGCAAGAPGVDNVVLLLDVTKLHSQFWPVTSKIIVQSPRGAITKMMISGDEKNPLFEVGGNGDLSIFNLKVADCKEDSGSGAFIKANNAGSKVLVNRVDVNSCSAAQDGGAIEAAGSLTVRDSRFSYAIAGTNPGTVAHGGAVDFRGNGNTALIERVTIVGGEAGSLNLNVDGSGGAVSCLSGNMTMRHVKITANTATKNGGGVEADGSCSLLISDSEISYNNTRWGCGGGAFVGASVPDGQFPPATGVVFRRVKVIGNNTGKGLRQPTDCGASGGGIEAEGQMLLDSSEVARNRAPLGAQMAVLNKNVTAVNSYFEARNVASVLLMDGTKKIVADRLNNGTAVHQAGYGIFRALHTTFRGLEMKPTPSGYMSALLTSDPLGSGGVKLEGSVMQVLPNPSGPSTQYACKSYVAGATDATGSMERREGIVSLTPTCSNATVPTPSTSLWQTAAPQQWAVIGQLGAPPILSGMPVENLWLDYMQPNSIGPLKGAASSSCADPLVDQHDMLGRLRPTVGCDLGAVQQVDIGD